MNFTQDKSLAQPSCAETGVGIPADKSETSNRVNYWERKLLDLTKSNSLINVQYGSSCIALTNEACESLYSALIEGTKYPLLAVSGDNAEHGLHTSLDAKALTQNAKTLLRSAQGNLEEIGNAQLFVALGMLHYLDNPDPLHPDAPVAAHTAPVLLVPVMITRQRITGVYYIPLREKTP